MNKQSIEETVSLYAQAWNQTEPETIEAELKKCCVPEVTYIDVKTPLVNGLGNLKKLIVSSYDQMPERTFAISQMPEYHNQSAIYGWQVVWPGQEAKQGKDYFEYNDQNLIIRIIGFIPQI